MRIISGIYKAKRLALPASLHARPTTDFAKENLFNTLANYVDWENSAALDLFSGTGSIAYEMASRGAKSVVCVEKDRVHYNYILKNIAYLQCSTITPFCTDVFRYIRFCRQSFDVVFADPPYTLPHITEVPPLVLNGNILNTGGVFIMEHGKTHNFSNLPFFKEQRIYGSVNFSIFYKPDENSEPQQPATGS